MFMDHPLCMELLCAELPDDSRRTSKGCKKRLEELDILMTKAKRAASLLAADVARANAPEGSPTKKLKLTAGGSSKGIDDDDDMPMFQDEDIDTLEMDLEKLLDAEDSRRVEETLPDATSGVSAPAPAGVAETAVDPETETQPGLGLDLELELEAMLDESGSFPADGSPAAPMRSAPDLASAAPEANSLEDDLEALLADTLTQGSQANSSAVRPPGTLDSDLAAATAPVAGEGSGDEEAFWEEAIQGGAETTAAASQQPGSAPEGPAAGSQESPAKGSQASLFSQGDTLEMDLEKLIDESLC